MPKKEEGTRVAIRSKGAILAETRVKYWTSQDETFTNLQPIKFPKAEYDWPEPDELVFFDAQGDIKVRMPLRNTYSIRVGTDSRVIIGVGDCTLTVLGKREEGDGK